jgi:hypothetical protein
MSPQILLKLGRVEAIESATYSIAMLNRPGHTQLAFGGGIDDEDLDENLVISVEMDAMISGGWRVIA